MTSAGTKMFVVLVPVGQRLAPEADYPVGDPGHHVEGDLGLGGTIVTKVKKM